VRGNSQEGGEQRHKQLQMEPVAYRGKGFFVGTNMNKAEFKADSNRLSIKRSNSETFHHLASSRAFPFYTNSILLFFPIFARCLFSS
jgi:hypothetical protein